MASSYTTNNPGKRPSSDSSSESPQPPKKRVLSRSCSPGAGQEEDQDDTTDPFKGALDVYQRDAISRQWKEYVRSSRREFRQVEMIKGKKVESGRQLHTWQAHFKQLQTDLQRLLAGYALETSKQQLFDDDIESILGDDWVNERSADMNDSIKANKKTMSTGALEVNGIVKSWTSRRSQFVDSFDLDQVIDKKLLHEYKEALSNWSREQQSINEVNRQLRLSKLKYLLLSEELRLLNLRSDVVESTLHSSRLELVNAESRLANKDSVKLESEESQPLITEKSAVSANEQGQLRTIMEHQQDPVVRAQRTLDQQLREIEIIKEQRIDLKQQTVQLELDLVQIRESRVYKSSICRQLHQSREYQRDKAQHLTGHVDKLVQDVEDMRRYRRRLMEDMDNEQMTHIQSLEDQLAKLEYQLTTIRGQRDDLQCKIELSKATSQEGSMASVKEWQLIAETRKHRASTMETEVARWLQKWAARTGSREFYHHIVSLQHHILSLDSLHSEQRDLQNQILTLKQSIFLQFGLAEADRNAIEEELDCLTECKLLEKELETFKSIYGFDPNTVSRDQVLGILQKKVKQEQDTVAQYHHRVEVLQSTENQLLDEISNIAKVYGEFDEQNTEKIERLVMVENECIQLQSERVKYSQTFTALNKSKDAHAMVANALTKQIEKQMAYIKQLNEREKSLGSQIASLERQLTAGKAASDIYQQRLTELKSSVDESKEKLIFAKDKAIEVEKSIMDKIRAVEEGAHSRLRMEEDSEILWRKIEATTKVEKPSELKLRKEKEEYRSLLNCSSCGTRLKSHVLMRCMHTFCKDCLDIRIETRQRRCPTCSEPFGINDVKQFYL